MGSEENRNSIYVYGDPHGGLYVDVVKKGKKIDGEAIDKIFDLAWAIERYTKKHKINEIYNGTPPGVPHIIKKGREYIHGYRPLSPEVLNRILKALKDLKFEI